jgi:hypothetical protein
MLHGVPAEDQVGAMFGPDALNARLLNLRQLQSLGDPGWAGTVVRPWLGHKREGEQGEHES